MIFQTQEIREVHRFKGFKPLAIIYAALRENKPLLEKVQAEES